MLSRFLPKQANTDEINWAGPFSVFETIVVDNSSLDIKAQAFFDLYKYKFLKKNENWEGKFKSVAGRLKSGESFPPDSIDYAIALLIYAYIYQKFVPGQVLEESADIKEYLKDHEYFVNTRSHGGSRILDEDLGLAYGLASDLDLGFDIDEIEGTSDSEKIFRINYQLGARIAESKLIVDEKEIKAESNVIINQNIDQKEKIPALLFCDYPEKHYGDIVSALIDARAYRAFFAYDFDEEPFMPARTVIFRFLAVSRLLEWDKLTLVTPDTVDALKKFKEHKGKYMVTKSFLTVILTLLSVSVAASIYMEILLDYGLLLELFTGGASFITISSSFAILQRKGIWKVS